MKLQLNPRFPDGTVSALARQLADLWRDMAQQVNGLSEGAIAASYNAQTGSPTQGTYAQGDFIPNKTPSEAGTVGNKYIVTGWTCVSGGTPGTWVETRALTGN